MWLVGVTARGQPRPPVRRGGLGAAEGKLIWVSRQRLRAAFAFGGQPPRHRKHDGEHDQARQQEAPASLADARRRRKAGIGSEPERQCPGEWAPKQPQIGEPKHEGNEPAAVVAMVHGFGRAL